jgi:type IV secretion system protein VirB11
VREAKRELEPVERELLELKAAGKFVEFFRLAVQSHQTIVVAGKTGSGKTTFMKGLVEEVLKRERLITIEDAAELTLPNHPNKLHLFYSKGSQGASAVTAKLLLEACLRLRPDRIFLAEMRGEEAFYFLRLAASGHPGSVTSVHAGSCELAFDQISLMVRESAGGGGMTMPEINQLARSVIDVVVHFGVDAMGSRYISGIHYDPEARLRIQQ